MKYRKPGIRPYEITGEVERMNAKNNCVYIVTSEKHQNRNVVRIEMSEDQVKQFIPFLYQTVKVQFIKGCLFLTPLTHPEQG